MKGLFKNSRMMPVWYHELVQERKELCEPVYWCELCSEAITEKDLVEGTYDVQQVWYYDELDDTFYFHSRCTDNRRY